MRSINVKSMIDESKFNRFHGLVLFWCAFVIVFDGFDLVVYGSVAPVLMEDWGLTPVQTGTLASYALFGIMLGALFFGPLADKIGRKNVIMICVVIFSLFTVLNGFASNPTEFGVYRFLAGLGFGGVMPNAVALMTEYSPKSLKSRLTTMMFSGYCVGGMLSAGIGIILIPKFGWESVFFVAVIPLITLPLMYKYMPDSIAFLLAKNKTKEVGQILSKVNPSYTPQKDDRYDMIIPEKTGNTVAQLFKGGRALSTVLIWITFSMCLLMMYGLNTWLPKIMEQAGYGLGSSIMFLLVLNFGAVFGAIYGGWAADRWNTRKVMIVFFLVAVAALTLLGFEFNTFVLYTLIAIAGATTTGTQIIAYAFAAQYYPTEIRSTGVGWASGIGRWGAIMGPMMGGFLITMNLPIQQYFLAYAIPGVIAAIALGFVREKNASKQAIEQSFNEVSAATGEK
ncbi:AAHS family benzoate transporter-like MFS transporter [Neobacillus niacini]|uniref:MFS transporter n=1 Tax=Neobacillus niacini TaxID=86668 RepID=UPI00286142F0|nr:aromatic acid/H+ symport family MFS transporter [Neobacillus niacini]MDR7079782.1 AAHS family benzoate transporter-like MFS transporter [Neobacillus niacini]